MHLSFNTAGERPNLHLLKTNNVDGGSNIGSCVMRHTGVDELTREVGKAFASETACGRADFLDENYIYLFLFV
jgi:hypothetical protein